jgi:hypothetical protein
MIRSFQHTGAVAAALLVAACAHTEAGMGTGTAGSGAAAKPVHFSWTSSDAGQTGTLSAVVGSRAFSGPFLQVRQDVRSEALTPLWTGWAPGWHDWGFWGPVPEEQFTTTYSGKVVANLASPDGARMRCRFHLAHPQAGMGGGGQGECQDGEETITAVFDRS